MLQLCGKCIYKFTTNLSCTLPICYYFFYLIKISVMVCVTQNCTYVNSNSQFNEFAIFSLSLKTYFYLYMMFYNSTGNILQYWKIRT